MDLTIITFLWYGDRWNDRDMGSTYLCNLYRSIDRNITIPFKFVCFTNLKLTLPKVIKCRRFNPPSWRGCLPRLWMYNPEAELKGQCLALDLDIIITGSLDDIASYKGDFCVRSKFAPGLEHRADGDIIGFRPSACYDIWNRFVMDPKSGERLTEGRERWWYRYVRDCKDRWQTLFPGQIISYKRHVRKQRKLPDNARIVSCHGKPRPHQIDEQWVEECWK